MPATSYSEPSLPPPGGRGVPASYTQGFHQFFSHADGDSPFFLQGWLCLHLQMEIGKVREPDEESRCAQRKSSEARDDFHSEKF